MNIKAKFRSSSEWKKLRKKIIARDKRCLICGRDDNLEAHHIIPLDVMWELRNDELNIITLCKQHHRQTHNGMFNQCYLTTLVTDVNTGIGKKLTKHSKCDTR